ncbi:MAG: hypothetical protein KDD42_07115 [Bdellovibrionales bacterium]|nr:hypothetical protein [Bdellovibrionales bacterium]
MRFVGIVLVVATLVFVGAPNFKLIGGDDTWSASSDSNLNFVDDEHSQDQSVTSACREEIYRFCSYTSSDSAIYECLRESQKSLSNRCSATFSKYSFTD